MAVIDRKHFFYVVGVGPGNRSLVTPQALAAVEESDLLVGGTRNLSLFADMGKEAYTIGVDMDAVVGVISDTYRSRRVAVLASGDPCFHSILSPLRSAFDSVEIRVIPGISSFQYLVARCGESWDDARILSMHGEQIDLAAHLHSGKKLCVLTDRKQTPQIIAATVAANGHPERRIIIGNELSYESEQIVEMTAAEAARLPEQFNLSVVLIDEA